VRSWLAAAFVIALLAVPDVGHACAVCFSGRNDESRVAFLVTTILMTGLPLLLIGAVVLWFRKRAAEVRRPRRDLREVSNSL
jgi:hypothetical protein